LEGRRVLPEVLDAMPFVVHAAMKRRPGDPRRKLAGIHRDRGELVRLFQETSEVRELGALSVAIDEPPRDFVYFQQEYRGHGNNHREFWFSSHDWNISTFHK